MESFDYVLVGAGTSAMGFLHGLLSGEGSSQDQLVSHPPPPPPIRVAVIERGQSGCNVPNETWTGKGHPKEHPPLLRDWYRDAHRKGVTTYRARFSQRGYYDMPTGCGRGGTTNIHAGLCLSPPFTDFSNPTISSWPDDFPKSLEAILQSLEWQRAIRPTTTTTTTTTTSSTHENDWNGSMAKIEFPSHMTQVPCTATSTGHRINFYQALVEPYLADLPSSQRQQVSIQWIHNASVERIFVDPVTNHAQGVLYKSTTPTTDGKSDVLFHRVFATREIILAAGVLESPALLVASGILSNSTVFPLRDHVLLPAAFLHFPTPFPYPLSCNGVAEIHNLEMQRNLISTKEATTTKKFSIQVTRMDATVYGDILPSMAAELVFRRFCSSWIFREFLAGLLEYSLRFVLLHMIPPFVLQRCLTVLGIFLLTPAKPVGFFSVKQPDKHPDSFGRDASPKINRSHCKLDIHLDYLHDWLDVECYTVAWPVARELAIVAPELGFSDLKPKRRQIWEFFPGSWIRKHCFAAWARWVCMPYFHWCSSLSGFVDADSFCLRSLSGLRVCDASILPDIPRAPTAVTCAAMGYHLARQILGKMDREQQQQHQQLNPTA